MEGTCGYAPGGDVDVNNTMDMTPAGGETHIFYLDEEREQLRESRKTIKRFQKLANIKK